MADFIYQMQGVDVVLPSGRTILKPTHLSFFPDAKIGVIGHNGAGKSTVLKIMESCFVQPVTYTAAQV